jgi:hypothetical protein
MQFNLFEHLCIGCKRMPSVYVVGEPSPGVATTRLCPLPCLCPAHCCEPEALAGLRSTAPPCVCCTFTSQRLSVCEAVH